MKILPNKINKFFDSILSKLSVPKKDRNLLIKSLLDSSIRGVDSHGIRLFSHYVKCIENGRIKAKPKMKLIKNLFIWGLVQGSQFPPLTEYSIKKPNKAVARIKICSGQLM